MIFHGGFHECIFGPVNGLSKIFFFTRSALINCFVFQKKIEKSEEMKFPGSITIIVGRLSISTRRNTTTSDGSSAPETSYTQRPWRKPSVTIYVEIEIPFFSLHSSLPSHMYLLGNYLIPQYPRGFIKSQKNKTTNCLPSTYFFEGRTPLRNW